MRMFIFVLVLALTLIVHEDLDGTFHWEQIPLPAAETAEEYAWMAFEYFLAMAGMGCRRGWSY